MPAALTPEEATMHQTDLVPLAEHPSVSPARRGQRSLSGWLAPARWKALGLGPIKSAVLPVFFVSLVLVLGWGASGAVFGMDWSSSAWQPIPTPAPAPFPVAGQVQPLLQADKDAGYDSPAQHDQWWNSVCSAAAFTEVARAWGNTSVTLGHALDRLLAHDPPYITVSGGLMSQNGWGWMAAAYHFQAQVVWHAYTFDTLVQKVVSTGVPVIIGMKGGNPANPWGHFVVVVGGDSKQAQVVDSSLWRLHALPRSFFMRPTTGIINDPIWWSGETILLTPA
jgi:hypothetical protein